ncbi:MAG: hypothetical protein QF599_11755, partial [Planctomycetota bacterium]|nr:hypothetical protein [Planctomycetota bacterium]
MIALSAVLLSPLLLSPATPLAQETAPAKEADFVLEPRSKYPFPIELVPPSLKAPQTLCGTAIRTKTFLQIKVHAFAIYADAPAMARDLAAWKGIESKQLEK